MAELVPIKVRISRKQNGHNKYPNFNAIDAKLRMGMDWSDFFDAHGLSWFYDKLSGYGEVDQSADPNCSHKNDDPTCWFGATCVPAGFADAAAEMFSDVTILSEAEWEAFHDNRACCHLETEIIDELPMKKLKLRLELEAMSNAPTKKADPVIEKIRAEMLDPDHPRKGIRKNPEKKWATKKAVTGHTIRAK